MGTMFGIIFLGFVAIAAVSILIGIVALIVALIRAPQDRRAARAYREHRAEFDRKYGAKGQRRPRANEDEENP